MKLLCRHYYLIVAKMRLKLQKKLFLKNVTQLLKISRKTFNPIHAIGLSLYTMKTSEKKKFSDFSGGYRKRWVAWNTLTRIPVLAKLQAWRPTTLIIMCSRNVFLWFLKDYNQLSFILTNSYEGFANSFSAKPFIEKLSVMPWKKKLLIWLYQYKMNFKVLFFTHINQCFNRIETDPLVSEVYLEPSQTSTMELFCGNS